MENAFAKLKALVLNATALARDALWAAIGYAIDAVTTIECANFFANAGYDLD